MIASRKIYSFAASCVAGVVFSLCALLAAESHAADTLKLEKGDHVVLIGNTLAERQQYFGNFETLLHSRFPELELVVRDLGWSADEVALRPRSLDFKDHGDTLEGLKADVVLAFFGFNESFGGDAGLEKFQKNLDAFITETTGTNYNGKSPARLALISPIAHENLGNKNITDGKKNNENIKKYTDAMAAAAKKHGIVFVDLFTPSQKAMEKADQKLTINGIHLNEHGDAIVAKMIDTGLFGARPAAADKVDLAKLKAEVNEKNKQFFYDHRTVNGYYVYGGRKAPYGVVNFPAEFARLRTMIDNREKRVWAVAQGKSVPAEIDDSNLPELKDVKTNFKNPIVLTSPEESQSKMTLPEGYEVNLFASEVDFPDLQKPVAMTFDTKGRLWVTACPSYPHYSPGIPANDKILIFEDTNGDGKADTQKVFADGLYLPIGLELGFGKVFVSEEPNLMVMEDTNGDDKADKRELIMHGFDSGDSHHACHMFVWEPGMALHFQEGTFLHTQIETPYGPVRSHNAAVYRFEPQTWKLDNYISYPFANPWGHYFDRWGQDFLADASGGANYYATAFSGDVDYPNKHPSMRQFLKKEWRPTAGCELVSSHNFPEDVQGDYLLNNCIGFQGTMQHRMREEGSGFAADAIDPLLRSSDPNFRPVALQFGPDGALYVIDWFNPLIGHMQHSIRDPNRDHSHGRIWRITYKGNPLVTPPKIAGESIPKLLDLLKVYENRTRYRTRTELSSRKPEEVMAALDVWISGLDKNDPDYQHNLLEALWVRQMHNTPDQKLLEMLLKSPDYRARAATTRVLCYWRDRINNPLDLLEAQANDENPRVRLEAIRALSFFKGKDVDRAREILVGTLVHPQDPYLDYTFKESNSTLEQRAEGIDPLAELMKKEVKGKKKVEKSEKLNDYFTVQR
jgi:glucose/arabinose dehydrogenase